MALNGFVRNFKPIEIATEEQIESIHRGIISVLQETGIRFDSKKALKLFEKNDCIVDYDNMRVKFPPALVEESLRKTPSVFQFKSRNPGHSLIIGGNTTYFSATPGLKTVDLDTWKPRMATRDEVREALIILDSLQNIHFLTPYTPYFGFEGIPEVMAIPEMMAAKARFTTKCHIEGYSKDCEVFNIEIANAIGSEYQGMMEVSSPLSFDKEAIESVYRHIDAGFPIHIASGSVIGASAPATVAGTMITSNAEIIAGIVATQLIKPGTRVMAVNFVFPQNMITGSPFFGNIGISLQLTVFCQLWRKYGVPYQVGSGSFTNSKSIDFQAGYEKSIYSVIGALSGAHMIQLAGGIHAEITAHPIQAILDDDVAGMIGRYLEGVAINDGTLALDLIREVGPLPGFFLGKKHTREFWKVDQFMPKSADIFSYTEWEKRGKKDAIGYARDRMEKILSEYKPMPLSPVQEQEIEDILRKARKFYKEKNMI